MNNIIDSNGKELKVGLVQRIFDCIKNNKGIFLTLIPLAGVAVSAIINFFIYMYAKGKVSYFNIPDEYIIVNYKVTVYSVIVTGGIALIYMSIAIWTVRTILRGMSIWKRICRSLFWCVIIPMIFISIVLILILVFSFNNLGEVFTALQSGWKQLFISMIMPLLVLHVSVVYGMGYCVAHPLQKDLLTVNVEHKNKKRKKKRFSTKWKKLDYNILGGLIITIAVMSFVGYCYALGAQTLENQKEFQIATIQEDTYVMVMTDGKEAVLEKCNIEDESTLKPNKGEYMKVKCENILMQNMYFENGMDK